MNPWQTLMRAVQKAATPSVWSAGVELVRAQAVVMPQRTAGVEELEVQVAGERGMAAVYVTLWPGDEDWSCACPATSDACKHAAAAVIALNQKARAPSPGTKAAMDAGQAPTVPQPPVAAPAYVSYAWGSAPAGLTLERAVHAGAKTLPLNIPLMAFARQHAGVRLLVQQADSAVDSLLAARTHGPLSTVLVHKLLRALEGAPHVTLDGADVSVAEARSAWLITLGTRPGGGVLVRMGQAKALTRSFANGAGLFGRVLAPLTAHGLADHQVRGLTAGMVFAPERHSELFGTLLPRLGQTVPIHWGDVVRRQETRLPPLLELQLRWTADALGRPQSLEALAGIVYGTPPVARVVGDTLRASGTQVPKRLREAEQLLAALVERELELRPGHKHARRGPDGVAWLQQLQAFAQHPQVVLDDADGAQRAFAPRGALTPKFELRGHRHFDLTYLQPSTDEMPQQHGAGGGMAAAGVSSETVQSAWARGESLVPLMGGGFAELPYAFLAQHGDLVALLLAAREAGRSDGLKGPGASEPRDAHGAALPPWALPHLTELAQATGAALPQELQALRQALDAPKQQTQALKLALPQGLTLRPYQEKGVAWLNARLSAGIGVLLADDMGLGKTLQALLSRAGRTLVVAPTSVLFNWADEAARLDPEAQGSSCIYHGPSRKLDPRAPLTITSYGILRQDGAALAAAGFETLILDEAQLIKNPASQTAQAAYALGATVGRRLALTGTPVENRLDELWSQCHFLNPGLLGTLPDFKKTFAEPIALGASPDAAPKSPAQAAGDQAAQALRLRLQPIVLRRTKAQVLRDLPKRTDVVLRCELTDEERAVYNSVQAATRAQVLKALQAGGSVMQALEALLRLRQAACHTGLVPGQTAQTSSKVELLMATLEEALPKGHRALVFSQWTSLLDRIEPHFRAAGLTYLRLDGSTADRQAVVRAFVAEDGPQVLLASLKAGGVGLNLTAADHVFLLDPWWNPAAEDQAADRAHRMGQQRPVLVHRLVASNTVEEHILRLQGHKRALAQAALNHEGPGGAANAPGLAAGATGLTREDLWAMVGEAAG